MGESKEKGKYFNCVKTAGGIWFSLLLVLKPGGVNSGQDCFTIHQFMLNIVNAKTPGAPFSSASTESRPALQQDMRFGF